MNKMSRTGLFFLICGWCVSATSQETRFEEQPKIHVFVSGLYNAQTFSFSDSRSVPLYLEEGSYQGQWKSETGPAFSVGGTVNLVSSLAVGAAFELLSASPSETFETSFPHPLYFGRPRSLEGQAASLDYEEKAVHVLVSYTRTLGRFVLAVTGGPSYFLTRTDVIDDVTFSESYPYDEVSLTGTPVRTYDANGLGFNVGGWFGFRLLKQLAVGADLKFTQAKPKFTTSAGNEIEIDAGGARVGVGIRLLF